MKRHKNLLSTSRANPTLFLPLRPVELQVLLSLMSGPRHGYAILQESALTGRKAIPDVGTLYRGLRRMLDAGMIQQLPSDPVDPHRKHYRITDLGLQVARAEARRLEQLVQVARGHGLLEPAEEG